MCDAHVSSNSLNRDETRFGIFFPFFYFTPFLILLLQRGRKRETKALVLVLLTAAVIDEWKFVFCSSATKWFPLFLLFVWHRPFLNESTLRSTHAGKKKRKEKWRAASNFPFQSRTQRLEKFEAFEKEKHLYGYRWSTLRRSWRHGRHLKIYIPTWETSSDIIRFISIVAPPTTRLTFSWQNWWQDPETRWKFPLSHSFMTLICYSHFTALLRVVHFWKKTKKKTRFIRLIMFVFVCAARSCGEPHEIANGRHEGDCHAFGCRVSNFGSDLAIKITNTQ